jgi:hypothetical protein
LPSEVGPSLLEDAVLEDAVLPYPLSGLLTEWCALDAVSLDPLEEWSFLDEEEGL